MRRPLLVAVVALSLVPIWTVAAATSNTDEDWPGPGWYRITVFPDVNILSYPYADEASCRHDVVPDKDLLYDCAVLDKPGDEIDRALDYWGRALKAKPDNAAVLNFRGILYRRKGDNANALLQHSKAIKAEPGDHWGYLLRAQVYVSMGQTAKAIADYKSVLARSPGADDRKAVIDDLKKLEAKH